MHCCEILYPSAVVILDRKIVDYAILHLLRLRSSDREGLVSRNMSLRNLSPSRGRGIEG